MITMDNEQFEGQEFAIQVISKGAFVDNGSGSGKTYIIEATTLRLNWVALKEWQNTQTFNSRDCYEDGPEGDAEWKSIKERCKLNRTIFDTRIKTELGIEEDKSVVINQVHSEVFTIVHIYQL